MFGAFVLNPALSLCSSRVGLGMMRSARMPTDYSSPVGICMLRTLATCSMFMLAAQALAQPDFSDHLMLETQLGSEAFDAEHDAQRDLVYVSLPAFDQIVVVSAITGQLLDAVYAGDEPMGIDISSDGQFLFIALAGEGAVARLNLDTHDRTERSIRAALGDRAAYDLIEAQPWRVFINGYRDGTSARVAQYNVLTNTVSFAANGQYFRGAPRFIVDPTQEFLYVGEGFSPNSLYKIDLSVPSAPVIREDMHGSVNGTQRAAVSHDGDLIYLSRGQVLDSDTFEEVDYLVDMDGHLIRGISAISEDGQYFYNADNNEIKVFDTTTRTQIDQFIFGPPAVVTEFKLLEGDAGMLRLSDRFLHLLVPSICPYDLVADNQINIFDIAEFIRLYSLDDPGADLNQDGQINYFDALALMQAYATSCDSGAP